MKVEFTIEEANTLIGLLDLAVKAGGLQVAASAVNIMQKLKNAAEKKDEE